MTKSLKNYKQKLLKISTIFLDIDGVLTDGSVIIASDGEQLRNMHVKDGYALQLAVKKGYRIVIISGGRSSLMPKRFEYLGITDVFLGVDNKINCFRKFMEENNITQEQTLYMGDDIPDIEVMKNVAIACCPADAAEEVKSVAHYISHLPGGKACVRDIIEQIMKVQGKWFDQDAICW